MKGEKKHRENMGLVKKNDFLCFYLRMSDFFCTFARLLHKCARCRALDGKNEQLFGEKRPSI